MIRTLSALAPLIALAVCVGTARAQTPEQAQNPPPAPAAPAAPTLDAKTRTEIFELVWSRVNERYFDPKFGGLNWQKVHDDYAPRITSTASDSAFYDILEQMLGELKASHFGILPPDAYVMEETEGSKAKPGTVGLVVQWVENQPTVTQVRENGGAARAGIKPGDVLTQIGDKPVQTLLDGLKKRAKSDKEFTTYVRLAFDALLSGPTKSTVSLGLLGIDNAPRTVTVTRTPRPGVATQFGQIPTQYVETQSRRLPGGVGYVRFNIFLMTMLEPVRQAMETYKNAPGLILDLRGNPGGIGVLAPSLANGLLSRPVNLGVMKLRSGTINFPVYPVAKPYGGPVVILVDEGSASTSEILAGSLQEMKRAVVIGTTTAGAVLPSQIEQLPGGARLQYAFADFRTPRGVLLEGRGVIPDIPVTLTRASISTGRDPVIQAALDYLAAHKTAPVRPVNARKSVRAAGVPPHPVQ